jgi:hypothetical protein
VNYVLITNLDITHELLDKITPSKWQSASISASKAGGSQGVNFMSKLATPITTSGLNKLFDPTVFEGEHRTVLDGNNLNKFKHQ